jgi:large subunit ribosomal protein L22
MLRIVGVNLPDDVDLYSGLRTIKGLETKHSRNKIERILTKSGLYRKKQIANGKMVKEFYKVGELSWKDKSRLLELVDIPRAKITNVRISARKMRMVADCVRGKHVDEALGILAFLPKAGAPILHKLLESAIANAGNNHELKADKLYVAKVQIDEGPTMRRFMARARGRACRIRKRTSHATIVLREKFEMPKEMKKAGPKTETTATTKAPKAVKSTKPAKAAKPAKSTESSKASEGGK